MCKGIEGEHWGELYDAYKEMSWAVEDKKPQEAQKAKALWNMKAAKDAGEEYYDPDREGSILKRNKTISALWEDHLKDPIVALDKALKCVENSCLKSGPESCVEVAFCNGWCWLPPKFVGKSLSGRAFGPACIRWIVCVCAQHPWSGMCQGSMGRMASSFSS